MRSRRCLFLLLPLASALQVLRPAVRPRTIIDLQHYDAYGQPYNGQQWAQQQYVPPGEQPYGQPYNGQEWAQQQQYVPPGEQQHAAYGQQMGYSLQQDLPAGWTSAVDQASGVMYYCFARTGECQWERPNTSQGGQATVQQHGSPSNEELVSHISQRLQEPQVRIVSAVVDFLGDRIALDLLEHTEQIQAQGGMIIPETGKPRTSGGVYFKLLKDAMHLPRQAQEAALHRIKIEGKKVKSWEKATVPGWH